MTGSLVASTKKRFQIFLMAMGTAAFLFLAVLAGTRLLHRQPQAPQVISVVASQQPNRGNTGHSLQKAGGQSSLGASHGASASNVKPSPASPRVGTSSVASNRLVQEGEVIHQVLPDVPQKAMNTIHGTLRVSVRVQVDASGNVVGADFDTPGPSQYFARLAMQAAKSWTFAPHPQEREFVIHFDFTNAETRAFATRAGR